MPNLVNGKDVWMIEGRSGARLLLEATQPLFIPGKVAAQQFERHLATEACIMSQKDFTHAPAPDAAPYLVMTDLFADNGNCLVIGKHLGGRFSSHGFDGIAGLIVRSDQRFNLTAQRWIISAGLTQKCRALRRVSLKCGLENLL